jgi:hydrazine synthase alpha subunit-like protein
VVGQGLGQTRGVASLWAGIALVICLLLLGYLPASPQTAPAKHKVVSHVSLPNIVFVQTPKLASGPLAQRFPQGSAIVRLSPSNAPHNVLHLTDGFIAAADPQVNFDGTKILFSGQKASSDHWQIWEMDIEGSHKRQISQCSEDCLRGAYLPADEIALTVEEAKGSQFQSYLAVIKTDGSDFHRITFGSALFQLETVLRDGRIVASAPWPLLSAQKTGSRMLYTLRPDGTALESFRCEHHEKAIQSDAGELADGTLLFVQKAATGTPTSGELIQIRLGALGSAPLGSPQAAYKSPKQISEFELIVAKQTITPANATGHFDLYLFNLNTGTVGERLYADPQLSSIQPIPVISHAVPKHYWNTLNPQSSTGNFISLNSYLSADAPHGRIATPISQVRVFTLNLSDGQERNLGEAPVEADGSFFVQVPANWPVRFVLLDAKGQVIREEHGWVWTRPGEERGCTGCHGDKAVAPDNRWPLTLRRFDTPTPLGEINHASASSQAK